ncbi:MAG: competence protein ComC [Prochlorococcus marinus CUG1438]|nr:competence protein ComC [Prochlorococcus marinus CUG1438]|tara:strand:- start:377 stop:790 length:414 start_codon:yes stop_codon:yes gene_type:complete
MSINKILHDLDKSWERDAILLKIKNGLDTDQIVNEFFINNDEQLKKLDTLIKPEHLDLLNQVEKLSTCESKLINKIKNLNNLKKSQNHKIINENKFSLSNKVPTNKIGLLMINWSNKFIVVVLLLISAIALSKQAFV